MIKIMSFNIRFENPKDGIHDWPNRKKMASDIVEEFATDILATQEGRKPQILDFSKTFSKLILQDSHRKWITERMYPCFFYNPEKIEIHDSGDIWLSATPAEPGSKSFRSSFPRLCTWMKASTLESPLNFLIVNTHLDHIRKDTRSSQIRVLIQEVNKVNKDNLPLILCGDFNEDPFGDVRRILNDEWDNLIDPWPDKNDREMSSFHRFHGELGQKDGGKRIDWILHQDAFSCVDIELDKRRSDQTYPSDHFPVKATLRF